jgi:hypothetical protein
MNGRLLLIDGGHVRSSPRSPSRVSEAGARV